MTTLKAIETLYKGYKFRSRLEARYAVFFDEAGIKWQYEAEGFQLPSGWYLPDFYLPEYGFGFVEIKPAPFTFTPWPKVYMAGRMAQDKCYRPFDIMAEDDTLKAFHRSIERLGSVDIEYTGPFRGSCNHGVSQEAHVAPNSDSAQDILERSIVGIEICDVFFAMFEDKEAFGSLVELGLAHARERIIALGFNFPAPPPCAEAELWFAAQCAHVRFYGDRAEILSQFETWLTERYPQPSREQRLAQDLAHHSGKVVTMCFGDPLAALRRDDDGGMVSFGEIDAGLLRLQKNERILNAATKARQAQFEHGRS